MYMLRRSMKDFGLDLVWDGQKVQVAQISARRVDVLETHEAGGLRAATEKMAEIEAAYHEAATAMC